MRLPIMSKNGNINQIKPKLTSKTIQQNTPQNIINRNIAFNGKGGY